MKRKFKLPRGICAGCGREFSLRAYKGDYLNACFPKRHMKGDMPCPGNMIEIEISREPWREE